MSREKNKLIKEIDLYVAEKIHFFRVANGHSRAGLAVALGVSQQQLCKYENGSNRVSMGKLCVIANFVGVEVHEFYANSASEIKTAKPTNHQRMCFELSKNFMQITNEKYRNSISLLVRSLAKRTA